MIAAPGLRPIGKWFTIALSGGVVATLTWASGASSEHARREHSRREAQEQLYQVEQALTARLQTLTGIATDTSRWASAPDPQAIRVWQFDHHSVQFLSLPGLRPEAGNDVKYATLIEQLQRRDIRASDATLAPLPAADGQDYIVVLHRVASAASASWTAAAESLETLLLDAGTRDLLRAGFDLDVLDLDSDRLLYQTRPRVLRQPESLVLGLTAGGAGVRWQLRAAPADPSALASLPRWVFTLLVGGIYAALTGLMLGRPRKLAAEVLSLQDRLGKLNEQFTNALREKTKVEEQTYASTHRDKSTDLSNRLAFEEALERELYALRRGSSGRLLVLVARLVSEITQAYGQREADTVLREAARRIQDWKPPDEVQALGLESPSETAGFVGAAASVTAPNSFIARVGEFDLAILMRSGAEAAFTDRVITELGHALAVPFKIGITGEAHVNAAFGLCMPENGLASASELHDQALVAAHEAGERSPRSTAVFEPTVRSTAAIRLQLEADLHRALRRGEFVLHYQPIVATDSAKVCGFEALLRWRHPLEGLLAPAQFLAVADSVGLMLEIDRLVLRQVALQARQWALDSQADFFLSFNLSPGHFARPEVATEVRQLLEECRVPAGRLRIEITESAIIGNIEAASRTAAQLRESGVKLCLDDFGTGYSSLNYLRVLPLDGLKIDRSFVERMVSDTRDFGVVKTIVDLAHYLQLYCVVEGVETSEQHELLQVLGADFLQGYLFSPAVPAEQAEQMLRAPTAMRRIA